MATRAAKVKGIAKTIPPTAVDDPSGDADVLVLGWGSAYGPITAAVRRVRARGLSIAQAHVRHLNPLPEDLGDVLRRYRQIVVPEMNTGQFAMLLRSKYLIDVKTISRVRGLPISPVDLCDELCRHCGGKGSDDMREA